MHQPPELPQAWPTTFKFQILTRRGPMWMPITTSQRRPKRRILSRKRRGPIRAPLETRQRQLKNQDRKKVQGAPKLGQGASKKEQEGLDP